MFRDFATHSVVFRDFATHNVLNRDDHRIVIRDVATVEGRFG